MIRWTGLAPWEFESHLVNQARGLRVVHELRDEVRGPALQQVRPPHLIEFIDYKTSMDTD